MVHFPVIRKGERRVRAYDAAQLRNPKSGILAGAEPMDLGPPHAENVVLFVHGFIGAPNNFHELPQRVAQAGWRARVMLLPGHGTTPLDFEPLAPDTLIDAVRDEVRALRKTHRRVVLLGHSMGGALATLTAASEPLEGLILAAPYYAVTHRWFYGLHPEQWAALLQPWVRWVYADPGRQPVKRREVSAEILSYAWIPTRAILTAIQLAERASAAGLAEKISCPALLLHGESDAVTALDAAVALFERLDSKQKQTVLLKNSDHIIFWDYDREQVVEEVLRFLAQCLIDPKK